MAEVLQKLSVKRFSATSCNSLGTPKEQGIDIEEDLLSPDITRQPAAAARSARRNRRLAIPTLCRTMSPPW